MLAGDFNTLAPGEPLDLRKLPPRLRLVAWVTGGQVRYETIQIMLDAAEAMASLLIDGRLAPHRFDKLIGERTREAADSGRPVRAIPTGTGAPGPTGGS